MKMILLMKLFLSNKCNRSNSNSSKWEILNLQVVRISNKINTISKCNKWINKTWTLLKFNSICNNYNRIWLIWDRRWTKTEHKFNKISSKWWCNKCNKWWWWCKIWWFKEDRMLDKWTNNKHSNNSNSNNNRIRISRISSKWNNPVLRIICSLIYSNLLLIKGLNLTALTQI